MCRLFALRVSSVTHPYRWTWTVTTTCCQALLLSYQPTGDWISHPSCSPLSINSREHPSLQVLSLSCKKCMEDWRPAQGWEPNLGWTGPGYTGPWISTGDSEADIPASFKGANSFLPALCHALQRCMPRELCSILSWLCACYQCFGDIWFSQGAPWCLCIGLVYVASMMIKTPKLHSHYAYPRLPLHSGNRCSHRPYHVQLTTHLRLSFFLYS